MSALRLQRTYRTRKQVFCLVLFSILLSVWFVPVASADFGDTIWIITGVPDLYVDFGEATGTQQQERAIKWTTQSEDFISSVSVYVQKIGSPVDNLCVDLLRGITVASSTLMTTSCLTGDDLPTDDSTISTFDFTNGFFLDDTLDYWFRFYRSGSLDDDDKYEIGTVENQQSYLTQYVLSLGSWSVATGTYIEVAGYATGITDTSFFQEPTSGSYAGLEESEGELGNFFKDILSWLFVPSNSVMTQYTDLQNYLSNRVPFSYYYDMETALEEAVDNVTSDSFEDVIIASNSGLFSNTTLIDWSDLKTYFSDKFSGVNTFVEIFSWIGFASYLLVRGATIFSK